MIRDLEDRVQGLKGTGGRVVFIAFGGRPVFARENDEGLPYGAMLSGGFLSLVRHEE